MHHEKGATKSDDEVKDGGGKEGMMRRLKCCLLIPTNTCDHQTRWNSHTPPVDKGPLFLLLLHPLVIRWQNCETQVYGTLMQTFLPTPMLNATQLCPAKKSQFSQKKL